MKVLFLHGWQSTPGGVKPTYLKAHGHTVHDPALPDDDFGEAVRVAQAEFDRQSPDVVVGSSRGGAVAMNIDTGDTSLVLLCPAWKHWGTATTVKPNTIILHAPSDETIPFADSEELRRSSRLPESALIAVATDHRLADTESLQTLLWAVEAIAGDGPKHLGREAGVPRRFGVGVLLLITTMYAVLFSVLRSFGAEPIEFALIAVFFTAVGLGQMLLFKGERPRRASMIVGAVFLLCPTVYVWSIEVARGTAVARAVIAASLSCLCSSLGGALLGYATGGLIAGVFLMLDMLNRRLRKPANSNPR